MTTEAILDQRLRFAHAIAELAGQLDAASYRQFRGDWLSLSRGEPITPLTNYLMQLARLHVKHGVALELKPQAVVFLRQFAKAHLN